MNTQLIQSEPNLEFTDLYRTESPDRIRQLIAKRQPMKYRRADFDPKDFKDDLLNARYVLQILESDHNAHFLVPA